jgi:hypothetical protein
LKYTLKYVFSSSLEQISACRYFVSIFHISMIPTVTVLQK